MEGVCSGLGGGGITFVLPREEKNERFFFFLPLFNNVFMTVKTKLCYIIHRPDEVRHDRVECFFTILFFFEILS